MQELHSVLRGVNTETKRLGVLLIKGCLGTCKEKQTWEKPWQKKLISFIFRLGSAAVVTKGSLKNSRLLRSRDKSI